MTTLFHDNRHLLWVSVAVLAVAGISAFLALPRLEDPRITNRNPILLTPVPGASADRVEALVTDELEDALQEISEIKQLESTSRTGMSVVSIELRDAIGAGENERVFSKIRDQLARVAPDLPPEAESPTLDDERDPAAFTLIVALTWASRAEEPDLGVLTRLSEELGDRLRGLPGTEIVRRYGDVAEEIRVAVDAPAAASVGLSVPGVRDRLRAADAKVSAGTLRPTARDIPVEVAGELDALERVRRVPLRASGNDAAVRVGDVARVRRDWRRPPREIGVSRGERCVYVAARMRTGAQIGAWSRAAKRELAAFRDAAGSGVAARVVFDQSHYTEKRLASLGWNMLLGAGVVMAVVFLTMGARSALIVGLALPLTVAATLFGVMMTGGALHQMSIFGMIIALGLLIDNAIVVVDELRKRRAAGMAPRRALDATLRHLGAPLLASTATTALAFAPIVLLPGNAGDFVGYIGGSVILAVTSSFLISMTVIAALAARHGDAAAETSDRRWWRHGIGGERLGAVLEGLLARGLRRPIVPVVLAALPALAGFGVGGHLGRQFFPPVDRDMGDVRVWLPRSSSVGETRRRMESIGEAIRSDQRVEAVHWLAGASFPSVYYNLLMNKDRAAHYAQGVIEAPSPVALEALLPELQRRLDRAFPGAQIVLRSFGQGPPVPADVVFRVFGPSVERLRGLGETIRRRLQAHPEVLHTRTTLPRGEPKLFVRADEDAARFAGYGLREIAGRLRARLVGAAGGSVLEGVTDLPVRVRTGGAPRTTMAGIGSVALPAGDHGWLPIASLGELALEPALGAVTRFDGRRCHTIEAYTREGALPIDVTRDVRSALERRGFALPEGYRWELGGALEQDAEAVSNLLAYAPILATMMCAGLVLAFRSVRLALLLGLVAGLSVGLALLSTWAIAFPVSFNTILGALGLIGVALNDSIVVLAAIRADPDARAGDPAGLARAALGCGRHVASTTFTTIGGFLPLLLFVGGDFWPSLAIVLAGGVGGATLLAIGLVPAGYRLLAAPGRRG